MVPSLGRRSADHGPSRRDVLIGLGACCTPMLAGCLGDSEDRSTDPVDLTDGQVCEVCGMEIDAHFGPAVQAFYADQPDREDGPIPFDSLHEFVNYDIDQSAQGNDRLAAYATDYASVDFEVIEHDDGIYLPTFATVDVFEPIDELYFVIDSDLQGAMGPDAFPMSDAAAATDLAQAHGGATVEWSDIRDSTDFG